jgi:hypothetical protein
LVSTCTLRPTAQPNFLQPLQERCEAGLPFRIACASAHEHADAPLSFRLLCGRGERPGGCCASETALDLAA